MLPHTCPACKQKTLVYTNDIVSCPNCSIYQRRLNLLERPSAWATGRYWWWRVPILFWFIVLLRANLRNPSFALNRLGNPFSALDMGMHELGHLLFSPFGEFMHILGGSLFQCIFPLLWLFGFLQKKWYFAATMCWCWLGINLFDVATYAADARARELPLAVGFGIFGVDPTNPDAAYDQGHDWYQLLSRTNHLNSDLAIAQGLRVAAVAMFVIGLTLGIILLIQMLATSFRRTAHD